MNQIGLRPIARRRMIDDRRLAMMQRRVDRARDDPLLARVVFAAHRIRLGCDDARQLIEELPHMRRQDGSQLFERALDIVTERRAGQRFEQRAAEIQRAQLGDGQAGGEALEGLAAHLPPRAAVVMRSIVVERKSRFFERLEVAPNRAGRDIAERRQVVDGDARAARPLDLAQDRPLADDFGVPGHRAILRSAESLALQCNV